MSRGSVWVFLLLTAVLSVDLPGPARADRITLRGGGQIRGKVVPDSKRPDHVQIVLERGKTPLNLLKAQVVEVVPEPSALDAYVLKRASAPETARGQFDLGLWCSERRLADLAELHYEAALKLDKDFAPAHEKLGHAQVQGKWLSGDQLREAQGMVRYKGRWITPEEKEQREKEGASVAEHSTWLRRIRTWRDALERGPEDRRREAEVQLMSVHDPAAVGPLVRVLSTDEDPAMRRLLAKVLGAIPGRESASAVVKELLAEEEGDVRGAFMDELTRRDEPEPITSLQQALKSKNPAVINRAAWALGHLKAVKTVPSLVGSLVTTHSRMEMVSGAAGMSEAPAINATFGAGPLLPVQSPQYGAPIAYNGSSIGYLNNATVGPGVVAFGASAVPAYPLPSLPNPSSLIPGGAPPIAAPPGASFGVAAGGGLNASRGPAPKLVSYTFQNTEVLAALVKLTGQDFGYDVTEWKRWLRTSFQPEPAPARRVPQP
ncbi:MAG: HEAT repeat domain-containing protein [Isosphaeraceae bacterium]